MGAKNAFGMRCPSIRENLVEKCENNYATYKDVSDSFRDFVKWINYNLNEDAKNCIKTKLIKPRHKD